MIIETKLTNQQIASAYRKAESLGSLRNSILGGAGNIIGYLGEEIFSHIFSGIIEDTFDYDVRINEFKIDVKTKETTVKPEDHYFATVADFNTKQNCDFYYFCRIDLKKKIGYLLGGLPKNEFYEQALFYREGDIDPTSKQGWKFRADCYNIEISKLKQPKSYAKVLHCASRSI